MILTADKGVGMVVLGTQDYISKGQELLSDQNTYRSMYKNPIPKLKIQLVQLLKVCK